MDADKTSNAPYLNLTQRLFGISWELKYVTFERFKRFKRLKLKTESASGCYPLSSQPPMVRVELQGRYLRSKTSHCLVTSVKTSTFIFNYLGKKE